jgi:two-component system, NarL family, invasion response regulator UvrY
MDILIVDDHPVVRRGVRQILEEAFRGSVIGEAENASGALDLLRSRSWDVVVLDITIPPRSGLDLLKEIKRDRPFLPVLVLSIHPEDQYAVRALRAGASGYMTKESAPQELVKALRKIRKGGVYVSPSLAEGLAGRLKPSGERPPHELLSDREYQVLCLIAAGRTVNEIAAALCLSPKTIATFRSRIRLKMGMKRTADLIRYAILHGLTP